MLFYSLLQGYVATPTFFVATLKEDLSFLHFVPHAATSSHLCCDIVTNICLVCLLLVSCTLRKNISSPLGVIRPL
ncbi:hypothetical protein J1N35_037523, partial [Gossypium stocksii]